MLYFKHFTKMRADTKVRRLFAKYGLEGYGLYNLIIESIAGSIETENPLPFLEETCDDIATFYNGNSTRIDEMVRFMIKEGLLEVEETEKKIACYKIYGYLEQSQTRSEKIRQLIAAYKDKKNILDGQKCLGLSQTNMIEEKRKEQEENRQEESPDKPASPSKPKRIKKEFIPPTQEEVTEYVIEKQLVIDPYKFIDWYTKTDWNDNQGKKITNWKNKAINWDSREREKNQDAMPYSKPLTLPDKVTREKKKCPKCGGDIRGSACIECYTNFDYQGNEI